jgi:hypothetical protein
MRLIKTGDDDDSRRWMFRAKRLGGLKSVKSGHLHVYRDPVGFELARAQHGFIAGGALAKCDAGQIQKIADHFPRAGVVIYNHKSHIFQYQFLQFARRSDGAILLTPHILK